MQSTAAAAANSQSVVIQPASGMHIYASVYPMGFTTHLVIPSPSPSSGQRLTGYRCPSCHYWWGYRSGAQP